MPSPRRLIALLSATSLLPLGVLLSSTHAAGTPAVQATAATTAADVAAAPGWAQGIVDPAHPNSPPVYYPLRQYMRMDCYKANPGTECAGRDYHKDWAMTLSTTAATGPGNNAIMAMGAGTFKVLRVGNECGQSSVSNMGTTVQIDHGGGWISRYGHLSNRDLAHYRAKDGKLVAAGERIGTMGMTGAKRCGAPYLNFHVEHMGKLVEIDNLTACVNNSTQQWPRDQYTSSPRYTKWNEVHEDDQLGQRGTPFSKRSFFPRLEPGERPASLDTSKAPDGSCIPKAVPSTPERPDAPGVTQVSKRALRVDLGEVPEGVAARVHVSFLRRSDNTWQTATYADVEAGVRSTRIRGLNPGATHRVTVSHGNSVGWSAPSGQAEQVLGLTPRAPRHRSLAVSRNRTMVRMHWHQARHRGARITGYSVGIRRLGVRKGRRWQTVRLDSATTTHRFTGLRRNTRYQVRVRALSKAGPSRWMTRKVTTRR